MTSCCVVRPAERNLVRLDGDGGGLAEHLGANLRGSGEVAIGGSGGNAAQAQREEQTAQRNGTAENGHDSGAPPGVWLESVVAGTYTGGSFEGECLSVHIPLCLGRTNHP